MKAYIRAYDPGVAHRNYDPRRGCIIDGYQHWDWRYKIVSKTGITLYHRQSFCFYDRAVASLCRNWPKVVFAVEQESR